MPRAKSTEQLNLRVPAFAKEKLRTLHNDVETRDHEDTSEPELIGALIYVATRKAAVNALAIYRKRVRAG